MNSYTIRREFVVWEEAEVFADSEDEAVAIAESKWPELSPEIITHFQASGNIEIVLPG
jgi:hypothetical protein